MEKPAYVAERNNSVWGHCELDFVDRTTVQVSEPLFEDIKVTCSKNLPISPSLSQFSQYCN